jgi:ABC-type transporter Mla subunit MlaD
MALQDLTPQLRTRLNRVERAVGVFVTMATLLLLAGFVYYAHYTAKRKGWFDVTVPYFTYCNSATGFKEGDRIILMGFEVGEITKIEAMPPDYAFNVFVQFNIKAPYFGYLWNDSKVKIGSADFLGKRFLEVTKGGATSDTNVHETYRIEKNGRLSVLIEWDDVAKKKVTYYAPLTNGFKGYFLEPNESPAITERLEKIVNLAEKALPNILYITNQISGVLTNSANLVARMDRTVESAQPVVTNLADITTRLRDPHGSLGEWLIPTNINQQVQTTLGSANATLVNANTNLEVVAANLNKTLDNLAQLTGNLKEQVQANSLMLTELSTLIINADDLVQGLKRHWLLKGPFGAVTNTVPSSRVQPSVGGTP